MKTPQRAVRPTIAMCCILKNEAHNISRMLQSFKGCFDQIVMVDTGSTDGSVEFLEKINEKIGAQDPEWIGFPKIQIEHFAWINDFSAARNYSFSFAKTDYIFWSDLDDELSSAEKFIKWRDEVLHAGHYWLAVYNYAFNEKNEVVCKFIRERVIKRDHGFAWEYFVHEGLVQKEGRTFWPQRVSTWWVNHRRSEEDKKQDHLRNVKLLDDKDLSQINPRMKFYYGKELFENGFPEKAGKPLMEAIQSGKLDIHDNLLAIQYAAQAAFSQKAYPQATDLLMNGLRLMPNRAEFWVLLGDVYLTQNQMNNAIMNYRAATQCTPDDLGGIIVMSSAAYGEYPKTQLAKIFLQMGNVVEAKVHIDWLIDNKFPAGEGLLPDYHRIKDLSTVREGLPKVDDIIITCPAGGPVSDWDENTLKTVGHGGSETAAIEVAKFLKRKTSKRVKVFHQRAERAVMDSGVEYLPVRELEGYLKNVEPSAHIAWRHSSRLTKAPSYVWCHDLVCPGAQNSDNYDKIIALSGFHKSYLVEANHVKEEKIVLGFNGIDPENFKSKFEKDPLKVVFSSSPDRGLIQTIDIVKRARADSGLDIKLHCFYGFENMRKGGQGEWADRIEKKIADNSFVKMHGQVSKEVLMRHFKEAAVWLYPADFIETYCITAIESLCAGTWPIVRRMGALPFTLKEAIEKDMCDFLDVEAKDEASFQIWADALVSAIKDKKWKRVKVDPEHYAWERVAEHFIKEFNLGV